MRATLQGVTQMGKSRPGATALRPTVMKRDGDRFASTPRAGTSTTQLAERGLALLKNK